MCKFEFMTCDMEPAVLGKINLVVDTIISDLHNTLARNVFLYTFILDNFSSAQSGIKAVEHSYALWNLFYHFFVPRKEINLLQSHALKLVQSSQSSKAWELSKYGKVIQFLGEDTLKELSRFWNLYLETKDFGDSWYRDLEARNKALGTNNYYHGFRSAGARSMDSLEAMSKAFRDYWKTGVVAGNSEDLSMLGPDQKGCINPMLAYSSVSTVGFTVHYGSDPLLGFHLAEAFDFGTSPSHMSTILAKAAKSQFHNWCLAFSRCLHKEIVQILVHCGEALNLCYELQSYQPGYKDIAKPTHFYRRPWNAAPLMLTESEGESLKDAFDIVDTSNLIDSVGILSVLPALAPLLAQDASSVLYTESLLLAAEDTSKTLDTVLLSNVTAFSLLVGITPVGSVIPTSTDSMGSEVMCASIMGQSQGKQKQFRMRIPWKQAALGDRVVLKDQRYLQSTIKIRIDFTELAELLFSMYLKMFSHEDISTLMSRMQRQILTPLAGDLCYYSRLSYVMLLRSVKIRVITDWPRCIDNLLRKIENDRSLLVGSNSLQELYMHMHLADLWRNPTLEQSPRMTVTTQFGALRPTSSETGILKDADVPPLVHVALIIPRSKLAVFTSESPEKIGTPGLHISISQAGDFENNFFAIDCYFGRLVVPSSNSNNPFNVEEDAEGWSGRGDLIATCPIPAFSLLVGPRKGLKVSLAVNSVPSSTVVFSKKLGMRMTVFECGLDDQQHLQILRAPPAISTIKRRVYPKFQAQSSEVSVVAPPSVCFNPNGTVKSITTRAQFSSSSSGYASLKDGLPVSISQHSPCTLLLHVGRDTRHLLYPYPIDGVNSKTRLSRKDSWVEVAVPISPALTRGGFDYDPFPVVKQNSKLFAWSFGRINLKQQPLIPANGDFEFLNRHMAMMLSQSERSTKKAPGFQVTSSLLDLKESIAVLFHSLVGQTSNGAGVKADCFSLAKDGDSDTLLFVKAMHHDLDTGSIVLNGFVVPVTEARMERLQLPLQKLLGSNGLSQIDVKKGEAVLWKQLFPALIERCRFSWEHQKSCEYISQDRIPLSIAHGEMPICSCGEGKEAKDFPTNFAVFAKFATRIAITPLSAIPYLESCDLPRSILEDFPTQARHQAGQGLVDAVEKVCSHCGTSKEGLKVCSRCEKAKYCNHACQKAAWKEHKKECRK